MGRQEISLPTVPTGAARQSDQYTPYFAVRTVGDATDLFVMDRSGQTAQQPLQNTVAGAGTSRTWQFQKGRPAIRWHGNGPATGNVTTWDPASLHMAWSDLQTGYQTPGQIMGALCWRVQVICCFSAAASGLGFTAGFVDTANTFNGGRAGVQVTCDGANRLILQMRRQTGGAIGVSTTLTGPGGTNLDAREYNLIDLRFVSAVNTTDGLIRVVANGTQFNSYTLGAGSVAPPAHDGVTRVTMNVDMGAYNGSTGDMFVPCGGVRVQSAGSEGDLL